ncbi:MAG: hypothetical protein WHT09_05655 [Thermogutta sp.]
MNQTPQARLSEGIPLPRKCVWMFAFLWAENTMMGQGTTASLDAFSNGYDPVGR